MIERSENGTVKRTNVNRGDRRVQDTQNHPRPVIVRLPQQRALECGHVLATAGLQAPRAEDAQASACPPAAQLCRAALACSCAHGDIRRLVTKKVTGLLVSLV